MSLWSKFFLRETVSLFEKWIPSAKTGSEDHAIPKCFVSFGRLAPNHIPSVLLRFTLNNTDYEYLEDT